MADRTIIIKDIKHFSLMQTLESGQCFRWEKIDENQYIGIAYNRVIKIGQINNDIYIDQSNEHDMKYIWIPYFDLNRDYEIIRRELSNDKILKEAIDFCGGIRNLNQQPFETLITYIISANNNIPRIKGIAKRLCENHGNEILFNNKKYHLFPTISQMSKVSIEDIDKLRAGFRGNYIFNTVKNLNESNFDLKDLKIMSYENAKNRLKQFKGVGDKVADCVLLFTGYHVNSFPVDVWVKKVMEELYLNEKTSIKGIQEYGRKHFKKYAGFANTYLFYYIRNRVK